MVNYIWVNCLSVTYSSEQLLLHVYYLFSGVMGGEYIFSLFDFYKQ